MITMLLITNGFVCVCVEWKSKMATIVVHTLGPYLEMLLCLKPVEWHQFKRVSLVTVTFILRKRVLFSSTKAEYNVLTT